jgi:type VII secretion protein EccE
MAVRGSAGRFGATQPVVVQLAILVVGVAFTLPRPWSVVVAGAGMLLAAGAVGRAGGRWGYEAVAARLRLWRHPGRIPAGLRTVTVTDRGMAIGIGQDGAGWFAVVSVYPGDGALTGGEALPLDWLAALADDATLPVTTLQVVAHHTSRPATAEPDTVSAQSYRELCRALSMPVSSNIWIGVRLAPRDGAEMAAQRGGGLLGIHRALATVLTRIGTSLSDRGFRHVVLDADGLRRALALGCGPDAGAAREGWSRWQAPTATHVCFAVRRWPARSAGPHPDIFATLCQVPGAAEVSLAVVLRRRRAAGGAAAAAHTLIRVAAPAPAVEACSSQLRSMAAQMGVRLRRLNGEHAAGVYATAPTGAAIGSVPW